MGDVVLVGANASDAGQFGHQLVRGRGRPDTSVSSAEVTGHRLQSGQVS